MALKTALNKPTDFILTNQKIVFKWILTNDVPVFYKYLCSYFTNYKYKTH